MSYRRREMQSPTAADRRMGIVYYDRDEPSVLVKISDGGYA
jgi:hypothetical protein